MMTMTPSFLLLPPVGEMTHKGGVWHERLSTCPEDTSSVYASAFVVQLLLGLGAATFGLWTLLRFESLHLLDQRITIPAVRNYMWSLHFMAAALRKWVAAGYLASGSHLLPWFVVLDTFLFSVSGVALFGALEYQRRHRSSPLTTTEARPLVSTEAEAVVPARSLRLTPLHLLFLLFFLLNIALLLARILVFGSDMYYVIFLFLWMVVRGPSVLCLLWIVMSRRATSSNYGPSTSAKVALTVGVWITILCDLPLAVWGRVLPDGCPVGVLSWVDLVCLPLFLSFVVLFRFLRLEFKRYRCELMWLAVQSA